MYKCDNFDQIKINKMFVTMLTHCAIKNQITNIINQKHFQI